MEKIKELLKNQKSKIIIGIILIIIIVILLLLLFPKAHDNDVAVKGGEIHSHTEKGIIKEEEYKGIKFTNISMLTEKGYTTFTADVTNVSKENIETERLHISLKNKDGKEIIKLLAYIPGGLKVGEIKTITASAKGEFNDVVSKAIVD